MFLLPPNTIIIKGLHRLHTHNKLRAEQYWDKCHLNKKVALANLMIKRYLVSVRKFLSVITVVAYVWKWVI